MEQDVLIERLSIPNDLEQIRKQLFELKPSITVSPPRSESEIQAFFALALAHGIPVSPEAKAEAMRIGAFTGVISEQYAHLNEDVFISAQLQPRYMAGGLHAHEYFELVCVCRGTVRQAICGQTMELHTGDFCIIAPGVQHDLTIFSSAVVIYISIRRSSFDLSFFKLFSPEDILHQFFTSVLYGSSDYPYILFHTGADTALTDLVLELYQETQFPKPYTNSFRFSCLSMLFLRLLRHHSDHIQIGVPGHGNPAAVVPILQYMQTHYQTVRRSEVAELFHYHEAYLSRLIKHTTGQTFSQLLQELRLQKAQQLLTTTNLPISEIVPMVGLSSVSHFHKIYLHRFGKTPKESRRQTMPPTPKHTLGQQKNTQTGK